MAKFKDFIKGTGNILYNNIVQIPFSVARGLAWTHCLPSHTNYRMKMESHGFAERADPDQPSPFYIVNQEKMDSQPEVKEAFDNHFYGKVMYSGERLLKGNSELEAALSIIPQHFVSLFSGAGVVAAYIEGVKNYGAKALIPLAVTTGLSLVNEIRFNRKLRNLKKPVAVSNS